MMGSSIATEYLVSRLGSGTANGRCIAPWSKRSVRDRCDWLGRSAHTPLASCSRRPTFTFTEVAYAAGFASIRQFNDTVREIYASTPSDLRRHSRRGRRGGVPIAGTIRLRLAHRRPADLAGILGFLAARAIPGVEEFDGRTYRRSLVLPHGVGIVELTPAEGYLDATLRLADPRDLASAVARCRRLFDLDADSAAVDDVLAQDTTLAPLVSTSPGRRVPGAVDGDELAVRAVLGQQVSVGAARGLAGRLVLAYGKPLDSPLGAVTHAFPTAGALAAAEPAEFPLPARRQNTAARTGHPAGRRPASAGPGR